QSRALPAVYQSVVATLRCCRNASAALPTASSSLAGRIRGFSSSGSVGGGKRGGTYRQQQHSRTELELAASHDLRRPVRLLGISGESLGVCRLDQARTRAAESGARLRLVPEKSGADSAGDENSLPIYRMVTEAANFGDEDPQKLRQKRRQQQQKPPPEIRISERIDPHMLSVKLQQTRRLLDNQQRRRVEDGVSVSGVRLMISADRRKSGGQAALEALVSRISAELMKPSDGSGGGDLESGLQLRLTVTGQATAESVVCLVTLATA
uniref:IF3_N domain-containing protein n=2 Tax=Macrostomum lignano TaxID=282301 RepID=A0A1I8GC53_9PLAT